MLPPLFHRCIIVLIIISFSSCSFNKETQGDVLYIKISDTKEGTQLYASDFISSIEYVALETLSQCLIGESFEVSISENYILVFNLNETQCLLFSREGKFIRKIGQKGNGPGEYYGSFDIKIDENTGMIFLMGLYEIYSYRITGEFIKKFDLRELFVTAGISGIYCSMHWKDDLFCANVYNTGKESYRFIIFSSDGEIVKLFPNYIHFETVNTSYFYTTRNGECHIFCYDEQIYFKELLCDTLFKITDQLELVPEIILDLPGEKTPTSMRGQTVRLLDFTINNIYKYENYLLLNSRTSHYLYDMNNNQLTMIKHDHSIINKISRNLPDGAVRAYETPFYGFTNDIDGGLAFYPKDSYRIQNDKKFVSAYHSHELKNFLTDDYLSSRKIKDLEAHKRLKKLLAELDEDDNPVLMIATVK